MTYPPNIVNSASDFLAKPKHAEVYFVYVDDQVYGPYSNAMMKHYVAQGRVVEQSLISTSPTSGFRAAKTHETFLLWQAKPVDTPPLEKPVLPSVFFVMADINSGNHLNFLKSLQTLGKVQRLSDAVWIIAAQIELNEIREILSRSLTNEDTLFIHDTFSNRAGWFNIGETADNEIRALWTDIAKQRSDMKSY